MADPSATQPHDRAPSGDEPNSSVSGTMAEYLLHHSPEYQQVSEIRRQGWESRAGDEHFRRQRRTADKSNTKTKKFFYKMMQGIGHEIQGATGCFTIRSSKDHQHRLLDFCAAPGGFLKVGLEYNPHAQATAFSLPVDKGGHQFLLPGDSSFDVKWADITMFAADMAVSEIPAAHPDAGNFLRDTQLGEDDLFDLVLCDGQVLRTHKRAPYREPREARRLTAVQLALGLEHLRSGGTMIILMHRVEAWPSVQLMHEFSKFSSVQLFKSSTAHATRSSFYLLATDICREHPAAGLVIEHYRRLWRIATFGTDEEYNSFLGESYPMVQEVLQQFGPTLVELGSEIWRTQTLALQNASFIRS